jgi:hypothetical protein
VMGKRDIKKKTKMLQCNHEQYIPKMVVKHHPNFYVTCLIIIIFLKKTKVKNKIKMCEAIIFFYYFNWCFLKSKNCVFSFLYIFKKYQLKE